jgi:heme-degrading monooxygenase HmoA
MSFFHITTHRPKEGKMEALIDSMHRFGNAIKGAPGLISVHTLRDENTGILLGVAIWESKAAMQASISLARAAVANDPFNELEYDDGQGFLAIDV